MARSLTLSLAAATAAALLATPVLAAPPRVAVEIAAEKTALTTSEDVVVRFTVRNPAAKARSVYLWETPLIEVENDLFLVQRNGQPVAYLGYIAKRGAPTVRDYVVLRPGQSLSARVELSALYDMSEPGTYTVQYRASLAGVDAASGASPGDILSSNGLTLELTGEPRARNAEADAFFAAAPVETSAVPTYARCSNTQQATLGQALPAAQTYASQAVSSLSGTAGARYTTWFGAYTSSRYNTVKTNFQSISSALDTQTIKFDCSCKKKYYAYVYPTRPYEIFLCSAFWSAPLTGTDSKAGTIIHEMSHFNVVAGTDDWAYGHSACKSLATSDPTKAVDNADSHEYYAENTPFLN